MVEVNNVTTSTTAYYPRTPVGASQNLPSDVAQISVEVQDVFPSSYVQIQLPEKGKKPSIDKESLEEMVSNLNHFMKQINQRIQFGVYDGTEQLYVRFIDNRTSKVIKMMPPEELLELRFKIELAAGLLFDEEV
jgi:flagellar protein FlaG